MDIKFLKEGASTMEKQYFIYLTINLINGKQYIGQHYGYANDKYLGSGVKLARAIAKYGAENFHRIILCFCKDAEEANQKEIEIIARYNAVEDDNFYNLAEGGRTVDFKLLNRKKEEWQKAHPEEHQKQIDEWRQKGSETNSKPILCITTGKTFESICAAARYYNVPQGNISKCLKGERKSAGKHPETGEKLFWKFIEKDNKNA